MDKLSQDPIMDHNGFKANPKMTPMCLDQDVEMGRMLIETFQRFDELRGSSKRGNASVERGCGDGDYIDGDNNAANEELPNLDLGLEVDYEKATSNMFQEVQTLLYKRCPTSRLIAILLLMNLVSIYGVSNVFVAELFTLLKVDLFPKDNNLPKSLYHVKRAVK